MRRILFPRDRFMPNNEDITYGRIRSETARFSDNKAYTLRPLGASVMAKTQPAFWYITAFSGGHRITLCPPLLLRSLREPQFYPQKYGAFSANSVKQLFPLPA